MNIEKLLALLLSLSQEHLSEDAAKLKNEDLQIFHEQIARYGSDTLEKQRWSLQKKPVKTLQGALSPTYYESTEARRLKGEMALAKGKVACLVLAGGQGTRLGVEGPKGKVGVTPILNKSLFQLICEKTKVLSGKIGHPLQLAIMASKQNIIETTKYFEEKKWFGLSPSQVSIICQDDLPFVSDEGNWELERPGFVAEGPCGNGKAFLYLSRAGLLENWEKQGVEYINVIQIDNALADPFDVDLIGLHEEFGSDVSLKVVERASAEETVGIIASFNGSVRIVEYSDLTKEERSASDDKGRLKLALANTGLMSFSLKFISSHLKEMEGMPWHLAYKSASVYDKEEGYHQKKMWKFEYFIFDLLEFAKKVAIVKGNREECYSPLKNASGDKSLAVVQSDLLRNYKRLYTVISGCRAPDREFELDTAFWYPTDEIKNRWKNKPLPEKTYIELESL